MDENSSHQQLDSSVQRLIQFRSVQVAGTYGFRTDEAEDIRQELTLDYLRRLPHYNPARCKPSTFGRLVVNNRVATIIATQTAARRDYRLREALGEDDGTLAAFPVPRGRNSAEERTELRFTVAKVLADLPLEHRRICHLLAQNECVQSICDHLGISPATAYRRLQQIRQAFRAAGLGRE